MNTFDAILKRRSIRKFKDIKVEEEKIEKLLVSAMAAPSARNMQPWEFYVVTNEEKIKNLRNIAKNFDFNSKLIIIVCGNKNRTITQNDNDFWIQDASAAVENILLCATELGLGSVWCGLFPVLERSEKVKETLNINEEIIPMALLHIGYPDEAKEERTQYNKEYVHYVK